MDDDQTTVADFAAVLRVPLGSANQSLGDCPNFRSTKMGLSPSMLRQLFFADPYFSTGQ